MLMKVSLVSRFPLGRQGDGVAAEFVLNPGETTTFILRQVEENGHDNVHDGVPAGRHGGPDADPGLLAAVAEEVQLFRSLARDGPPLGAGVKAADVRAHRRDRGGADLRAAGRDRRGAAPGRFVYIGAPGRVSPLRLSS